MEMSRGDAADVEIPRRRSRGDAADAEIPRRRAAAATRIFRRRVAATPRLTTWMIRGDGVGRRYEPLTSPPDSHQSQHDYEVEGRRSVLSLHYAPDARMIAVATVGGPPMVARLPIAKHRGSDLHRCTLGVDDAASAAFSHCGNFVVASGGPAPPRVFRVDAKSRVVDAPHLSLKEGGAGARFYYLDRFLVSPRDGAVELYPPDCAEILLLCEKSYFGRRRLHGMSTS